VLAWVCSSLPLSVVLLLAGGCQRGERETFIALERDFQRFQEWEGGSFTELPARGQTHFAGQQGYFIKGPKRQGKESPVGTVIVKQARLHSRPEGQLFAMVKRGGAYNANGARGWEWFELALREDQTVAIKWRGLNAPSGEGYGSDLQQLSFGGESQRFRQVHGVGPSITRRGGP
jgi:hypothetical protein